MLGGRSGAEAEASADERTELLREGFEMLRHYPFGVGVGQYNDHTSVGLTAHNSYMLEAAELGLPGMFLWALIVYTSVKIPYIVAFRPPPGLDPRVRALGDGLFVAYCGMLTGITFLSFAYHPVLWTYFGLSGGLYGVARRADPTFEVRLSQKEVLRVCGACVAFLVGLFVYLRLKG
jgi:O-antigen ligase